MIKYIEDYIKTKAKNEILESQVSSLEKTYTNILKQKNDDIESLFKIINQLLNNKK